MNNRNAVSITAAKSKARDPASKLKLPQELEQPIELAKVNMDICKPVIGQRLANYLGVEDEIVVNFVFELLQPHDTAMLHAKHVYSQLVTFLEQSTIPFLKARMHNLALLSFLFSINILLELLLSRVVCEKKHQ